MTETIMFNFDQDARNSWLKALRASMQEFPDNRAAWETDLQGTYGIRLAMLESGIAGVEIIDADKAVLFKLRWL